MTRAAAIEAPLLTLAHVDHLADATPALRSAALRRVLGATPRVADRVETLLSERLEAPARALPGDDASDETVAIMLRDGDAALERRLMFVGAISYGPALRRSVLREEVAVLVEALGWPLLRAALDHAELGRDQLGLDLSSVDRALFCFEQRAAEHFAAWLGTLDPGTAERAALMLSPLSPVAPARPEYGDATLIPAVAPVLPIEKEETAA